MRSTIIRKAVTRDAVQFHRLKEQLPMNPDGAKSTKGGFLLGTTVSQYCKYIEDSHCLVAEVNGSAVGFGILIPDAQLRATDIWLRRQLVDWNIDLQEYEQLRLSYFEQLAFLPQNKRLAIRLAYHLITQAFDDGAEALFTTTVNKPVKNLAAIPFIQAVAGIHAGNIDEYYPSVGAINSDVYIIRRDVFYQKISGHPLYSFLTNHTLTT